jgi:glutamate N-acetyltransferase/amino-acid N-acetyltransferase
MFESDARLSRNSGIAVKTSSAALPNNPKFKRVVGSVCAPRGFRAAAVHCGIKQIGTGKGSDKGPKRDLGLIVSDIPAAVAGTFTTNKVCAAPVRFSASVAARSTARAVVVNSGNANACTGAQGMRDARRMAACAARVVAAVYGRRRKLDSAVVDRRYSFRPNDVLVCSTGRIGIPKPMKRVEQGIRACGPLLIRSKDSARAVAEAIMTSDTRRKEIAVEIRIGGKPVRIGGICKGAGMIQPRMAPMASRSLHATMLAFITSDAAISSRLLKAALIAAVEHSFNRISVDGDMSTNDSVIVLANGLAQNNRIAKQGEAFRKFQTALTFVCLELAKMIVRDGEGVSRFVTVRIHNARTFADAEKAARAIANSSLVRTSWCGGDPNWGRILCALGYSGAAMDETLTDVGYSRPGSAKIEYGFCRGRPTKTSIQKLGRITGASDFDVHVDLHQGRAGFVFYSSDLTEEYVTFNKGDITDPESLGG